MVTIKELTAEDYKNAVDAAVDLVRTKYPDLDLRAGTALRALLIEPSAFIDASQRDIVNRLRTAMSLEAMSRETTVPQEDANAVLSNFGITLGGGTKSTGLARVNVISTSDVTIRAGVTFTTEDGVEFVALKTVTASLDPADGEERLESSNDGRYYFTVPVEAVDPGASGNIVQGCALTFSTLVGGYYSSEAFSDFTGGSDGESVSAAVARIPAALAYRGMTNALSVRAQLSASLPDPSILRAVSCVGYRDRAQLRDKHNPFGISTGGRVDVYARMFEVPGVVSFIADGDLIETVDDAASDETPVNTEGRYKVPLPDYPGFYAVKCITPAGDADSLGSLQYDLVRDTVDGAVDAHDFLVEPGSHEETAWSAYQSGYIVVHDNTDGRDHLSTLAVTKRPLRKSFKVDLYWTDGIAALQETVDDDEVRNVAADYVVRTPAICLVGVNAGVRLRKGVSISGQELAARVEEYINSRSFVRRLTRSEIANILIESGAESVDLGEGGMRVYARVCGADGVWYYLDGDSIDVSAVGPERAMLTAGTVVFGAEQGAVQIQVLT